MDNISIDYQDNNKSSRKSSCTTIVPSPPAALAAVERKACIPLTINCNNGGSNTFYDTNSRNDVSPTTIVSSKRNSPIYNDNLAPSTSRLLQKEKKNFFKSTIKSLLHKWRGSVDKGTTTASSTTTDTTLKATYLDIHNRKLEERQEENEKNSSTNKVIRHSYSDSHLSPGSTAVGDDEERNGYFGPIRSTNKKKKTPRGWVAAVLMIIFGALIAITFVLVGLGKALGGNTNSVTNAQQKVASNSTTTTTALPSLASTGINNQAITTTIASSISLDINTSGAVIIQTTSSNPFTTPTASASVSRITGITQIKLMPTILSLT